MTQFHSYNSHEDLQFNLQSQRNLINNSNDPYGNDTLLNSGAPIALARKNSFTLQRKPCKLFKKIFDFIF